MLACRTCICGKSMECGRTLRKSTIGKADFKIADSNYRMCRIFIPLLMKNCGEVQSFCDFLANFADEEEESFPNYILEKRGVMSFLVSEKPRKLNHVNKKLHSSPKMFLPLLRKSLIIILSTLSENKINKLCKRLSY